MQPSVTKDVSPPARKLPLWALCLFFMIAGIPYGSVVGFATGWVPRILDDVHHLRMKSIGWYAAAVMIPAYLRFLYAPIVDIWLRRKTWLLIVTTLSATCLCLAIFQPLPEHFGRFVALIFAAKIFSGLISASYGGLMATLVDPQHRGKIAGWNYAGNLGAGGLVWFLTIKFGKNNLQVAQIVAVCMLLPAAVMLSLPEPRRAMGRISEVFGNVYREFTTALKSKDVLLGMLFCLSPVGTVALTNLFSGMGHAYQANKDVVAFFGGGLGGLISALGSIAGGYLCDRFHRRSMYLLSGVLTAVVCMGMVFANKTPTTYAIGLLAYFLVAGLAYAAFNAVVLESIGKAGKSASAQYALFVSAGNFAIFYMEILDTRWERFSIPGVPAGVNQLLDGDGNFSILNILDPSPGVNSVLFSDAVFNLLGVLLLALAWGWLRHHAKRKRQMTPGVVQ